MATTQPIKSSEDIQRVRAVLDNKRDRALFELGLHLAFRGGDLLTLNLRHVINKVAGDEVIIGAEKKTSKQRITNLNEQCIDILKPLIRERQREGATLDDALFVAQRSKKRLTIVSLSRLWSHWCKLAGLEGTFASHTGRKTKAYIMRVEDEMPIEVLMKVLNHSSPAMTLRYASIQDDECKQFYMRAL
ncbi:MAG: tyrosine-type recombinase/integrase [Polaromonas sp.]|nr:tyrosine-type recombinase/integrase [Polaromonas sp.]